ncbi:MAG: cell division protein SepF [Firmicutes bacterium]|nr:cell division protein SepF [Bacillota bacterium]
MGFWRFISKGVKVEKKEKKGGTVTLEPPVDYMSEQPTPLFKEQQLDNSHVFNDQSQYLNGQVLGNRNVLVIAPSTNQDVTNIVQNLQNGEACVINLENIPLVDAQRRLDFLSGVICAMSGSIRALDKHKYILTPQGLGVRNR